MTSKKVWLNQARGVFKRVAEHRKPYEVVVHGKKITVLPDVFSPKYFTDSEWFAKKLAPMVGKKSLLEIGVGTGIIALWAALHGAQVAGADINPAAVKNTKLNFKKYGIKAAVWQGSVFKPVPKNKKFDFIFWNHPFNYAPSKEITMLERAGLDYKYKGLQAFFLGAKAHLKPGGQLLLGTGNIARIKELKKIAAKAGYDGILLHKAVVPFDRGSKRPIDLRIYRFIRR